MDTQVLVELCEGIRSNGRTVNDEVLDIISDGVDAVALVHNQTPGHTPPPELLDPLWALGWLIYEASWSQVDLAQSRFESADPDVRERGGKALDAVRRIATDYRRLAWPEFAPRGLGAIRSEALLASKKDTDVGYREAWVLHREALDRYESYSVSVRSAPERYELGLLEVLVQLALAETGTACRETERVVGRWTEEVSAGTIKPADEDRIILQLFRALAAGVDIGNRALEAVEQVSKRFRLAAEVSVDRLALDTAWRNPGIMTARAALLAAPFCLSMKRLGHRVPGGAGSWEDYLGRLLSDATSALGAVAKPVNRDGVPVPLSVEHARSVAQLMVHLAFVSPCSDIPVGFDFADWVQVGRLDSRTVENVSAWLAEPVVKHRSDGSTHTESRGNANVIGTATMPSFIYAILELSRRGCDLDYIDWRTRWSELDRYSREPGRKARVGAALTAALASPWCS